MRPGLRARVCILVYQDVSKIESMVTENKLELEKVPVEQTVVVLIIWASSDNTATSIADVMVSESESWLPFRS